MSPSNQDRQADPPKNDAAYEARKTRYHNSSRLANSCLSILMILLVILLLLVLGPYLWRLLISLSAQLRNLLDSLNQF